MSKLKAVSLFCGCGGTDVGLKGDFEFLGQHYSSNDVDIVFANDIEPKAIEILEENGEPNEAYKYLAINTFQQNWDLEAEDFHQMFRSSFSKVSNLLYQNSWGFIEKSTPQ